MCVCVCVCVCACVCVCVCVSSLQTDTEQLLGVVLDGYPIYGPYEGGAAVSRSSLDMCGGKVGPDGRYRCAPRAHLGTSTAKPTLMVVLR